MWKKKTPRCDSKGPVTLGETLEPGSRHLNVFYVSVASFFIQISHFLLSGCEKATRSGFIVLQHPFNS